MSEDKFEVSVDKETHTLYVNVEVFNKPEWQGISFYDGAKVREELNKQGYNISEKDCIGRGKVARSDSGNGEKYSTSKWKFKLAHPAKEKEEAVLKTPPVKKTSKKTSRQTTKSVLKSYKKR